MNSTSIDLLATNTLGWCVFRMPGDTIQLDFGAMALVFSSGNFCRYAWLLHTAFVELIRTEGHTCVLAKDDQVRQVLYIQSHDIIAIYFDGTLMRFSEPLFQQLFNLCAEAMNVLDRCEQREDETREAGTSGVLGEAAAIDEALHKSSPPTQFGFSLN